MNVRAIVLAVRLAMLLLPVALVVALRPGPFGSLDFTTHVVLAVVSPALVLAIAAAAYLARPSVRRALGLFYHFWAGNYSLIRGSFAAAERHFLTAVDRAERLSAGRASWAGRALCQLGDLYRIQGRLDEAAAAAGRALEHFAGESPPRLCHRATALSNLAVVGIARGRFAEAEPLCREALDIFTNELGGGHEFAAMVRLNLGRALVGLGRCEEAEGETRRALAALRKQVRRGWPSGCVALLNLADLCRRQGRLNEAESLARRAVALYEGDVNRRSHATLANFLNVLAEVTRMRGRPAEAESLCRRSRDLTEGAFGPGHVTLDGCLSTLARVRAARGECAEAAGLFGRCLSILEGTVVPEHPELIARREEYAALLRRAGRPDEGGQRGVGAASTQIVAMPMLPRFPGRPPQR